MPAWFEKSGLYGAQDRRDPRRFFGQPRANEMERNVGLKKWRGFFMAGLVVWIILLTVWMNLLLARLQAASDPHLPAGVITLPNGQTAVQDFSYQMLFFRGIRDHEITRPYRMADQETFFRREVPSASSGMTHAYSPVAFVLALPLIATPGLGAYLIYTAASGLGILLLFRFWLLPRANSLPQLAALAVCALSVCLVFGFEVGQSAIFTTTLVGALWALLQRHPDRAWGTDLLLALLLWALCLKPSVTIVPVMLLLAARAWRPLILGVAFLFVTWTLTCGHYGGWWIGLQDYSQLLNHYNNAGMSSFLRRGAQSVASFHLTEIFFSVNRALLLGLSIALLLLRWLGRISASEHFQGTVCVFALFSPYFLPSELWILVLIVAEGPFFRAQSLPLAAAKLLLLAAVLDLRDGMALPVDVNYPLKCLLAAWILFTNSSAPTARSSSGRCRETRKSC